METTPSGILSRNLPQISNCKTESWRFSNCRTRSRQNVSNLQLNPRSGERGSLTTRNPGLGNKLQFILQIAKLNIIGHCYDIAAIVLEVVAFEPV